MSITIDKTCELGRGSNAIIYRGTYGDRPIVAVKIINVSGEKAQKKVKTDIDTMITCDAHENICRYYGRQDEPDTDRILLALEFCEASLQKWMNDMHLHMICTCISSSQITKTELLHQTVKGLAHLHENRIIHRDLKPTNILLAVDGKTVRVKLSDFGISKFLSSGETSSVATGSVSGTERWRAPEVLTFIDEKEKQEQERMDDDGDKKPVEIKIRRAADIFSLGCIFYYVLKDGNHPFGKKSTEIRENVLGDNPTLASASHEVIGSSPLIRTMIAKPREKRPPAAHIRFHHMFWPGKAKLQYLVDVSNLERNPQTKQCSDEVEKKYQSQICAGHDGWIGLTSPDLQTYLKTRKPRVKHYTGKSVMELVRAIRNLQNHYGELPYNISQILGNPPDEFINYWLSKFPFLLHHVWIGFQPVKSKLSQYYSTDYDFSDY